MGAVAPARLTKEARRDQLLNAAAQLVVERGISGITMEGLAEQAGVSKALPYQHFDNARTVLIALYQREIGLLGQRVMESVEGVDAPAERVRRALHAYFDVVSERGRILGAVTNPASNIAAEADDGVRTGVVFVADLLVKPFGIGARRARLLASMFLGTLAGATESWVYGDAGRSRVEATLTSVFLCALADATKEQENVDD